MSIYVHPENLRMINGKGQVKAYWLCQRFGIPEFHYQDAISKLDDNALPPAEVRGEWVDDTLLYTLSTGDLFAYFSDVSREVMLQLLGHYDRVAA